MGKKGNGLPSLSVDRIDRHDRGGTTHVKYAKREAQDVSHLLGFSLPPRQRAPASAGRKSSRAVPYTRERFVHATYRFVLNPTGDYTAHFCDPDIYFYWPNVLQVIVSCDAGKSAHNSTLADQEQQENFCPICLSEPSAPRMTKCGHIFCYPCLLHLFELSETSKWVKCPVCADTIHPKDLKSVAFSENEEVKAEDLVFDIEGVAQHDDTLTLKLMERPRITTLALPRSSTWPSEAVPHLSTPWVFSPDAYTFARFMLATPEYMLAALHKDLAQLVALSGSTAGMGETELDGSFVAAAKRKVTEQMDKAEGLKTIHVMTAKKSSAREISETLEKARKQAQRQANHLNLPQASTSSASSSEEQEEIPDIYYASGAQGGQYTRAVPGAATPASQNKARKKINPPAPDNSFLYYQAASGANVFLHPLDIKILLAHYKSYSAFPDTINVRVEGREEGSMNEDLRRKCRYLSHLPAASDITFLELDLESLIGSKSLEAYANPLKMRRNKRKDKAKREDKAKFKSEEKEREKQERDFRTTIHHSASQNHVFHTSESQHLDIPHHRPEIDDDTFPSMSPPSPSMLPVDSIERNRTVWGTRSIPTSALPESAAAPSNVPDEWDAAWRQWEASASTPDRLGTASAHQQSTGKKKPKKQKLILF